MAAITQIPRGAASADQHRPAVTMGWRHAARATACTSRGLGSVSEAADDDDDDDHRRDYDPEPYHHDAALLAVSAR